MKHNRVTFRKWNDDNEIIAILWDVPTNIGVMMYEHIGQHGEGDYNYILRKTKPASPEEYKELKAELESIGYNLKVVKRMGAKVSIL